MIARVDRSAPRHVMGVYVKVTRSGVSAAVRQFMRVLQSGPTGRLRPGWDRQERPGEKLRQRRKTNARKREQTKLYESLRIVSERRARGF